LRWLRISILGALTAGIILAVGAGLSYAARPTGQVGYGAPQVLGDQFINPHHASSAWGLWSGLGIAFLILFLSAFYGWFRTHHNAPS